MPADELAAHPDQIRWNARYAADPPAPRPHLLARRALAMGLPDGPVADLACGPSGSALLAARSGLRVTAVDISRAALDLLAAAARRDGVPHLITLVHADLRNGSRSRAGTRWCRAPVTGTAPCSGRPHGASHPAACWPGRRTRPPPARAGRRCGPNGAWRRWSPHRCYRPDSR